MEDAGNVLHHSNSTSDVYEHLNSTKQLRISPTDVGSIIKSGQCPRYMKLQGDSVTREQIFESDEWVEKASLEILATEGNEFEATIYEYLDKFEEFSSECVCIDLDDTTTPSEAFDMLEDAIKEARDDPTGLGTVRIFRQFPVQGDVGPFSVAGDSDLVCVYPLEDGVDVRVIDVKASWEEKTSQQIQTSIYTFLIRRQYQYLEENNVRITAGILHRENYESLKPPEGSDPYEFPPVSELPQFEVEPREDDAERLLSHDSSMYQQIKKIPTDEVGNMKKDPSVEEQIDVIESTPYQIDTNCELCEYRDVCFTRSIETLDVSLLGVSQGTREAMKDHGIHSLRDLSDVTRYDPENDDYMEATIKDQYRDVVLELQREHGVQDIKDLSLQAKLFIGQLSPAEEGAEGMYRILPQKSGIYPRTLPDFERDDDIDEDEGIKIFMNVQYDYIADSIIQMNAKIKPTSSDLDGTLSKTITKTIKDIPAKGPIHRPDKPIKREKGRIDIKGVRTHEERLAKEFTDELLSEIETIADTLGIASNTVMHFYLYSKREKDWLVECMDRHSHIRSVDAFRNLLGVRDMGDEEQQLWGFLEDDIKRCYLINRLPTFLPSIHEAFSRKDRDNDTTNTWKYKHNGEEYNLDNMFREQFFNYKRNYVYEDGEIILQNPVEYTSKREHAPEGTPVESYTGSQLPLEYFWGCEEFDLLSEKIILEEDEEEDMSVNPYILQFLYKGESQRISKVDLEAFGSWVVDAIDLIESGAQKTYNIKKEGIDVRNLHSFKLDSTTFADSIEDYVRLEHSSNKEDLLDEFQKPISTRIREGKAIPIQVTDVELSESGYVQQISGDLIYEDFGFENVGFVKSSSKKAKGDYVAITPFEQTSDGVYVATDGDGRELSPENLLDSPSAAIQTFDTEYDRIRLSARSSYGTSRRTLVSGMFSDKPYEQPIHTGQKIILDSQLSTFHRKHALETLEHSLRNRVYTLLDDMIHVDNTVKKTEKFDIDKINEYLQIVEEHEDEDILAPNEKQRDLIRELSQICLLQGPPGTGKTSGALTSMLVSRIHSATDWSINGAITGPSNRSVDEMFDKMIDRLDILSYNTDLDLNVSIYRLLSSSHEPEERKDKKDNVNYIDDVRGPEARELIERIENQQVDGQHILIFGTPSMIKRFLETQGYNYMDPKPWFDLFVADEASMLTLQNLLMAGAFINPDGQIFISGDHRQMSPVQKHEWADETRPNIQQYVPYLSVLNFMRFLRGDEIEQIVFPDKHIPSPEADIPLKQLELTYRCHETVAEFLQKWVYSKDNIDYTSKETRTLQLEEEPDLEGVQSVLDDEPMVIVTHSDTQSQESNIVEALIGEAIMEGLGEWDGDSGVVTPHSSQKGLLRDRGISDEADTVERFQGGERDLIMVSATVSDPAFIRKEDDFLLNPNRVNVAISRMKKKLILIVSESVFAHVPSDVDVYDNSVIWNGLYNAVIQSRGSEEWSGSLSEFVGDDDIHRGDVDVNVYTKE